VTPEAHALPAAQGLVSGPAPDAATVFREPWEAHAFALALALHQRGIFTWAEWSEALGAEVAAARAAGDPDRGDTYYRHWLRALERLADAKGAGSASDLARYRHAWSHAAGRTPHGEPLELRDEDFQPA
jgi:nitrile hydratase accessory protein